MLCAHCNHVLSVCLILCLIKIFFTTIDLLWLQLDALTHPFFEELRDQNTRLPNGRFLPPLFNFKSHGMKLLQSKLFSITAVYYLSIPVLTTCCFCCCLTRIEGSFSGDPGQGDSRACKKAMSLSRFMILLCKKPSWVLPRSRSNICSTLSMLLRSLCIFVVSYYSIM